MLDREQKRVLKRTLVRALKGKLPLEVGGLKMIAAQTGQDQDEFLNVKVYGPGETLLTYFEVRVKESLS